MPTKCPKCGCECIENEVAVICPNCDFISMKKTEWKGEHVKCPKCKSKARVFKNKLLGKSFVCDKCNTIGRFFDENKLQSTVIRKDSEIGKKLSWLFEVPCKDWKRKEEIKDTICKKCDLKEVCDAHLNEIEKFCNKKDVEVYMHNDFIEVVHK
ncbi:hypothetical protein JXB41_08175 [Candidatus Woesearchaeota archaeon]|nr:hypothetical protein [Candidatus Woesearchaeota archaeon]